MADVAGSPRSEGARSGDPIARRAFLERLAALTIATPLVGWRQGPYATPSTLNATDREGAGGARELTAQQVDQLLAVVAAVVLPRELGPEDTVRAFQDFRRWRDGYRPEVEMNHGYGTARLTTTPADPRPRWREQLLALDGDARRAHGKSLDDLEPDEQEALVRAALAGEKGESFPSPATARHVAVAVLAHFYESPLANDLCYEAEIGRQQCRPLDAQTRAPVALRRRGSRR